MDHNHENENDVAITHGNEVVVNRRVVVTNMDRPPLLSWGAVFGGLVFVVAISWLLNLLGIALGVSILDATDGDAVGNGLAIGAIVWTVLSWLIAFFVGSLFTARLSGKVDDLAGMLHGMALWGVATTLMIALGYMGVSGVMQTGYSLMKSTASTAMTAVSETADAAGYAAAGAAEMADSELADNINARLKRRASTVLSRVGAEGGADIDEDKIKEAIESLDSDTLQEIATHIVMSEMTQAREELTSATNLSDNEVRALISGIETEFEEELGMEDSEEGLAGNITKSIQGQLADFVANLDEDGGVELTKADVQQALKQLNPEIMGTVSMRLINGDIRGAKDALASKTDLSNRQINEVVDGVNEDVSRTIKRYQTEAAEAVETATSYATAVLWTIFVASAMALAVSLIGGWLGAESSRRLEVEVRREVV